MKISEMITFMSDVIKAQGDLNVKVQIDTESGVSQVTGFWTRVIPVSGERVLIISNKAAQI